MNEMLDDLDDTILAELRQLHEDRDPMPPGLTDEVKFAMTVEALHAEVAEITSTPLAEVRADTVQASDTITFSTDRLSLMVTVTIDDDATMTIDGWLSTGAREVEVHASGTTRTVRADDGGRFAVHDLPRGRTWFVVRDDEGGDGAAVVTPAVEL